MNEVIKVFSKVYVGFQGELDVSGENPCLGFLTPYEENAAGRKRIETVEKWSAGHDQYGYVDGKWVVIKKAEKIPSQIFENTPMEGFEICREVKRTYWGGGNVVWRIFDPRGFELEISSANLAKILTFATLEAGKIKGKCVWGRLGANNILVPEGCPEYSNLLPKAEEFTEANKLRGKLIPISQIKIGSTISLSNGTECVYLGKWNILTDDDKENLGTKVVVRHIVRVHTETTIKSYDSYYAVAELKVLAIAKKPSEQHTIADLEKTFNQIKTFDTFGTANRITSRLVCAGKIDLDKVKTVLKPVKMEEIIEKVKTEKIDGYSNANPFKIESTNKIKNETYDWTPTFLVGKMKDGRLFTLASIQHNMGNMRSGPGKIDFWTWEHTNPLTAKGPNLSILGRVKHVDYRQYYHTNDGFGYSLDNSRIQEYRDAILKFLKEEVESINIVDFEFETPDGELITNTLHVY